MSEPVSACELAGDAVIFGVYSDVTLDAGALAAFGLIAAVVTNRQPLWFVSDYQLHAAAELNNDRAYCYYTSIWHVTA